MLVKFPIDVHLVEKQIGFPVVVKPISGSQGSGVFQSESRSTFADLMQLVESTNQSANIILQELLDPGRGRDLRVLTPGGRVVACMQRRGARVSSRRTSRRAGPSNHSRSHPRSNGWRPRRAN